MADTKYRNIKDLASANNILPGTSVCPGCGALETLRMIFNVLGEDTVVVNAAGCMTMLASYPFTPFRGSWLYTAMASAPAGAQGVRDALDILISRGNIPEGRNIRVVVLAGDGSSYGMGLSATSSAMDRNLDFYYICYDNEGYGNTGYQESPATPAGAMTSMRQHGEGHTGSKKDLFAIWTAHSPAYAATVTAAEPLDLARKVEKSMELRGPKMFLAFAPCPTNWHYDPCASVEVAKLAVKTGIWPLKEYTGGKVTHTKIPERIPVEQYMEKQGRYSHLFHPRRNEQVIKRIQEGIDRYWDAVQPAVSM